MRTIFIISDAPIEFSSFQGYDFSIKFIEVEQGDRNILFTFNADLTTEQIEVTKGKVEFKGNDSILLLYHNDYTNFDLPNWLYKFDVGTGGYATTINTPRWYYEKLLADKIIAFEEVWEYFQNRIKKRALHALKTSFLDDNIYTNTCPICLPSELSTPELVLLFEPIKGKEFNRIDQSYMMHFEKFKSRLNELYQDI